MAQFILLTALPFLASHAVCSPACWIKPILGIRSTGSSCQPDSVTKNTILIIPSILAKASSINTLVTGGQLNTLTGPNSNTRLSTDSVSSGPLPFLSQLIHPTSHTLSTLLPAVKSAAATSVSSTNSRFLAASTGTGSGSTTSLHSESLTSTPTTAPTQLYGVISTMISGSAYHLTYVAAKATAGTNIVKVDTQTATHYVTAEGKCFIYLLMKQPDNSL